jgi:glucose-1-phosphate cytidylyltransferase
MVEIGGKPILWHIMKHYAHYGFREFVIALGYKGEYIKEFFVNYSKFSCDLTVDLKTGQVISHNRPDDEWKIHLMDTGDTVNTGGRVKRLQSLIGNERFMLTYGDGVADVNINELLEFHVSEQRIATMTAVRPPARFGGILFEGNHVKQFTEKPQIGEGWINGGFLVFEPPLFEYLLGDDDSLESDALDTLASERQLAAYRHEGFWQCMDTLRDKRLLEKLWTDKKAPWKTWK